MAYTIGDIARLTGMTAFTIRYYEKIGVLPRPGRSNGNRSYGEDDLRYVQFVHGLKRTGMTLEDIAAFTEDGCLLTGGGGRGRDPGAVMRKRADLLERHIGSLEQRMRELDAVRAAAEEKRAYYAGLLAQREEAR